MITQQTLLLLPHPLHPLVRLLAALHLLRVPEHVRPVGSELLDRLLDVVQCAVRRASRIECLALGSEGGVEVGFEGGRAKVRACGGRGGK